MDPVTEALLRAQKVIEEELKLEFLKDLLEWLRQWFPGLVVPGFATIPDPSDETVEGWSDAQMSAYAEACKTPVQEYEPH